MIAVGALRPVLVGAQVVATFGVANVAGALAAVNYQNQQAQSSRAAVSAAESGFDMQVHRSVDEGTPQALLDPLVAQERALKAMSLPAPTFVIDQQQLDALHRRVDSVDALTNRVIAVETQVEAKLHQRLLDALANLQNDMKPAQAVSIDTADYQAFVDGTTANNQDLQTPQATQAVIDSVNAKDQALKDATAQKVAAIQALSAATDDARNAVASAQNYLTQAQAIPVLNVAANASAIADLAKRLAAAVSISDFQSVAAGAWAQSSALKALLNARQSAYDLLAETRHELGLAQGAGKDVSSDQTQLDAAAKQLDAASDLPSVEAAATLIQTIKNDIDAKYWQAIYGSGRVIVVSIYRQELMALQDGVAVLDTLVTTGRPSMPTLTGVYHVFAKYSPYCMTSWQGNPYPWNGCAHMQYAMEWESSGYFIHDAPWRSVYGPGTNTEANGTHGCINVPRNTGQMDFLYGWTPIGTTVVVLQGDFGSTP